MSDENSLEINEMIVYELLQYDSLRKLSFKYNVPENMAREFAPIIFVPK